jgi:hypothetical protein
MDNSFAHTALLSFSFSRNPQQNFLSSSTKHLAPSNKFSLPPFLSQKILSSPTMSSSQKRGSGTAPFFCFNSKLIPHNSKLLPALRPCCTATQIQNVVVADKLAWSTPRRFEFPAAYGRVLKQLRDLRVLCGKISFFTLCLLPF